MIATLARETALIEIRRRGRSNHLYGYTSPVIELRKANPGTMRKAAAAVAAELTHRDRDSGRQLSTISAQAGLSDVLLLISQGFRQIGVVDVSSICGVSVRTAQTAMATLRKLDILGGPRGVKGLSMTTWYFMPHGVELLTAAFSRIREALKLKRSKHAKFAHRVTPPPKGRALQPPPTPQKGEAARPAGRPLPVSDVLQVMFGSTGLCEHETLPTRCAICRRRRD